MAPIPELMSTVGRLAKGQLPRPDQEGEHKADQEVVEEFECITENGGK